MIFFDRTQRSVVVGCRQCGVREVVTAQAAADSWATMHVYRAHPGPTDAEMQAITASDPGERARALAAARKRKQRNTPR